MLSKPYIVLCIQLATAGLLTHCSDTKFQSSGGAAQSYEGSEDPRYPPLDPQKPPPQLLTSDDVITLCEKGAKQPLTEQINFPRTVPGSCPWGENDNLLAMNAHSTARVEQTSELKLPTNAVICSLDISTADNQNNKYDDQFLIHLNQKLLVSSSKIIIQPLTESDGFYEYDWKKLRGHNWNIGAGGKYCLDMSRCTIPKTESVGPLSFAIPTSAAAKLSALIHNQQNATFTMVTVGDDNRDTDCFHRKLLLNVTGTYVIKP